MKCHLLNVEWSEWEAKNSWSVNRSPFEKQSDGKYRDLNPHSKVLCGSTGATKNGRVRTGTRTLWAEPQTKFLKIFIRKRCVKCSELEVVE